MKILFCIIWGYLLGCLNPAALISKLKHKSLRENGSGNLGTTNTLLVFGKKYAALVLAFDMAKSLFAFKTATWVAPEVEWLGLASGFAAVVGHCFPFYLKFKGGKGLASFAGVVLAYRPLLFLFLLFTGMGLMIIVNYSFILPFYAASFFAVYAAIKEASLVAALLAVALAALIIAMHFGNFKKVLRGQENRVRDVIKAKFFH